MGYVVDLTLILQAIFQVSLQDPLEGKVAEDRIDEIIYEFHCSDKKKRIHDTIRSFVGIQHPFAKESVVEKIELLIKDNEVCSSNLHINLLLTVHLPYSAADDEVWYSIWPQETSSSIFADSPQIWGSEFPGNSCAVANDS